MKSEKSVVISGASSGIGRACALHLDGQGFRVWAGVRQIADGAALQQLASDRLRPVILDVSDASSITTVAETVREAVGSTGLAGLVNNAGTALSGPLEHLPLADIRREVEVNLVGTIAVTQAFLPLLRQGRGRIINMGSVCGRVALPFASTYSASKFALEALTDALRLELQSSGIHVALVEPGAVATPIWEKFFTSGEQLFEKLPPQAKALYGASFERQRRTLRQIGKFGLPPEQVALTVGRALTARHPKTRYLIGPDARAADLLGRLVPDRLRDLLIPR